MSPPGSLAAPDGNVDVVHTYRQLLAEDPDLTMPVAAIEALITVLASTSSSTVSETLDLVSHLTAKLKANIPNPISLSAGTDLFQQYLIANMARSSAGAADFDQIRSHLVQNGRLFVERAKAARDTIGSLGWHFVREGHTILTLGGSRVVGALLRNAAEGGGGRRSGSTTKFRVICVVSPSNGPEGGESSSLITSLRERNIPVATVPPTAIAYCMDKVTQCFVGAEGVVENGGIVSRLGTYQTAVLAKAAGKPFYVVAESHKFVRLYPLGQQDLGIEQNILDFRTARGSGLESSQPDESVADVDIRQKGERNDRNSKLEDAVDYTPPHLIAGIITESGVLLPSAVSEELIKIWF